MPTYLLRPATRHTIQATSKVIHTSYPRIIYVIELDSAAADDPIFAKDNPHLVKGMTCLYVGSSGLTAEERMGQHLRGVNAANIVFITTNSIHQTFNRRVLEYFVVAASSRKPPLHLALAIPDHLWIDSVDGAAVRIAMTVAATGPRRRNPRKSHFRTRPR